MGMKDSEHEKKKKKGLRIGTPLLTHMSVENIPKRQMHVYPKVRETRVDIDMELINPTNQIPSKMLSTRELYNPTQQGVIIILYIYAKHSDNCIYIRITMQPR